MFEAVAPTAHSTGASAGVRQKAPHWPGGLTTLSKACQLVSIATDRPFCPGGGLFLCECSALPLVQPRRSKQSLRFHYALRSRLGMQTNAAPRRLSNPNPVVIELGSSGHQCWLRLPATSRRTAFRRRRSDLEVLELFPGSELSGYPPRLLTTARPSLRRFVGVLVLREDSGIGAPLLPNLCSRCT
jgi:hypothetical protein